MSFPNPEVWPPPQETGTQPLNPYEFGGLGVSTSEGGQPIASTMFQEITYDRASDTDPQTVTIRWCDNDSGKWSKEHVLTVNVSANMDYVAKKFCLGMYVSRQWEIVSDVRLPLCIVSVEEEVEGLQAVEQPR